MTQAAAADADGQQHYKTMLAKATRTLGGTPLEETFSLIEQAGSPARNARRIYHTLAHFREISGAPYTKLLEDLPSFHEEFARHGLGHLFEVAAAVMMRAGAHHDIVYHVDSDYAPSQLLRREEYRILPPQSVDAPASDYLVTAAEPKGEAGVILDMARMLFDVMPRDLLTHFTGKNEFLSAVYAGLQGAQEQIPLKYLLAEMTIIEATRPFDPPDRMQRLRARMEAANHQLPQAERLDPEEMEAFLLGAVQLANVDVMDFSRDFSKFLKGSVSLLQEAGRRIVSVEDYFIQAVGREAFFQNLLEKLRNGDVAVFHALKLGGQPERFFPPRGVVEICEQRAQANIHKDILMSRALKVSAALGMMVEALHGNASMEAIPGRLQKNQMLLLSGYPAMRDPAMMETAMAMRDVAPRVPLLALASFLLGHLEEAALRRLSEKVSHQFQAYQERFAAAFATRKTSLDLLEWLHEQPEFRPLEPLLVQALGYEARPSAAS